MVLVRLAYAADLPTPGDLMRRLGDSGGEARSRRASRDAQQAGSARARSCHAAGRRRPPSPTPAPSPVAETEDPAARRRRSPNPKSFEEVVALAEEKRDLKLKHALLRAGAPRALPPGHLELNPLPHRAEGARPGADAQAQGLDRPRVDRRLERRGGRSALGRAAPRARGARDRAHSRAPRRSSKCCSISPARASPRCGRREPSPRRPPRSTTGPRLSSRRTGPTDEEFRRA